MNEWEWKGETSLISCCPPSSPPPSRFLRTFFFPFCFYSFTLDSPVHCTHTHTHPYAQIQESSHTYMFPYTQTLKGAFFPHRAIWCRQAHGNHSLKTTHSPRLENCYIATRTHTFPLAVSQIYTCAHMHTRQTLKAAEWIAALFRSALMASDLLWRLPHTHAYTRRGLALSILGHLSIREARYFSSV